MNNKPLHVDQNSVEKFFSLQNNFVSQDEIPSTLLYGYEKAVLNPLVSIVVTAYKRPDYLKLCLEAAVNQDCDIPYEIVVVDNNDEQGVSPNQTVVEQLGSPKVLYYRHQKNMGYHGSANRGIELARGEFICFCHDDDTLLRDSLSTLMKIQKKTGDRAIIGRSISQDEVSKTERNSYKVLSLTNCFVASGLHSGSLFKRSCLLQLGGYNKNYAPCSDYALDIQYCDRWGLVKCFKPTFFYRVSESNASNTVYDKFIERDYFYRECMKQKIPLPNFYLDAVNNAFYNSNKILFAVSWGGKDKSLLKTVRLKDKLLIKSYAFIARFFSKEYDF